MTASAAAEWSIVLGHGAPEPELLKQLAALAAAAEEADGNPPLSEQTLVELRGGDTGHVLVVAAYLQDAEGRDSDELVGAAVALLPRHGSSTGVLELVVHPQYRNDGIGTSLVEALKAATPVERLHAWSHGNSDGAAHLAAAHGFTVVRELWRMRWTHSAPLPEAVLPPGVRLRSFVPGRDEAAWLRANADAFASHPEQGAMTAADLAARMSEPWFDPEGFLLAEDEAGELLGFHWTKVHPPLGSHPPIGEVYVVGVTAAAQGRGLGKALTVAGMRYLQSRGLHAVMLYVDADNAAAVALYRRLGFTRWDVDAMYAAAPEQAASA
jgi:mycothiol synthase